MTASAQRSKCAKSKLAGQVETRGFPNPRLTFVRDELRPVPGKPRREKIRNFWAVGTEGTYTEGNRVGYRYALELLAVLQSGPSAFDETMLGQAMAEATKRGPGTTFERGVLIGFCWALSTALIDRRASVAELRAKFGVKCAEYDRKMEMLGRGEPIS